MYNQSVGSYSSVGQSVRLITVRSAVQARVGAFFVALLRDVKKSKVEELCYGNGSMAEWSKAPALGAGPKGRGFEPHCCHSWLAPGVRISTQRARCVAASGGFSAVGSA